MFDTFVPARLLHAGDLIVVGHAAGLTVKHTESYGGWIYIHFTNGTVVSRRPNTHVGILREREYAF